MISLSHRVMATVTPWLLHSPVQLTRMCACPLIPQNGKRKRLDEGEKLILSKEQVHAPDSKWLQVTDSLKPLTMKPPLPGSLSQVHRARTLRVCGTAASPTHSRHM